MDEISKPKQDKWSGKMHPDMVPSVGEGGQLTPVKIKPTTGMALPEIIKARIIVAQSIDRDIKKMKENILEMLEDEDVCKAALYSLPRKNKGKVFYIEGLSMKFIKELAREYKHLDFGFRVIEQGATYSKVMAYCYDLRNNTSHTKEWKIQIPKYVTEKKNASEEIYKYIYSEGAKRERSCIERIIPEFLQNFAKKAIKDEMNLIVKDQVKSRPIEDRFQDALFTFKELDDRITQVSLLDAIKKARIEDVNADDITTLQSIYTSIKDNIAPAQDYFPELNTPDEVKETKEFKSELDQDKTSGFYKGL